MPHQCLECGHLIPDDEAVRVLRGCAECKGTRFYYTMDALTVEERADLSSRAQKDVRQVVAEMLQEQAPEVAASVEGDWAELKPRDLRRIFKEFQKQGPGRAAGTGWEYDDVQPVAAAGAAKVLPPAPASGPAMSDSSAAGNTASPSLRSTPSAIEAAARRAKLADEAAQAEPAPETVEVGDGAYGIDVRGLLERNPIVVHKDGAYLIHLPSLFGDGKKR